MEKEKVSAINNVLKLLLLDHQNNCRIFSIHKVKFHTFLIDVYMSNAILVICDKAIRLDLPYNRGPHMCVSEYPISC